MRNILIVGAGFAGATYARLAAEDGLNVTVIDRRNHLAGNAHDHIDANGVRVHTYGPHLFHTSNSKVFEWLTGFEEFVPYEHRVRARLPDERLAPLPINLDTLELVFDKTFATSSEAELFLKDISLEIETPRNAEEYLFSRIGVELTNLFFRPYTAKMWEMDLSEVAPSVVARIPLRFDRQNLYFPNDKHQGLPRNGYTKLFECMLQHDNIDVQLSRAFDKAMEAEFDFCFLSNAIDEYFDEAFGPLPYRSIKFRHEDRMREPSVDAATINYTDHSPYTRETHWWLLPNQQEKPRETTTVTVEQPCSYVDNAFERYYPVKTQDGRFDAVYEKYRSEAEKNPKVSFIGRCGTYQYLNMDQVINQSFQGYEHWKRRVVA